jgi:hypothetical protein
MHFAMGLPVGIRVLYDITRITNRILDGFREMSNGGGRRLPVITMLETDDIIPRADFTDRAAKQSPDDDECRGENRFPKGLSGEPFGLQKSPYLAGECYK